MRYRFLEQVYLLTGSRPGGIAYDWQLAEELDLLADVPADIVEDLERVGFLIRCGDGSGVCITDDGVEYLRRGAWRRRSVRL
jgi:hypothetical protein